MCRAFSAGTALKSTPPSFIPGSKRTFHVGYVSRHRVLKMYFPPAFGGAHVSRFSCPAGTVLNHVSASALPDVTRLISHSSGKVRHQNPDPCLQFFVCLSSFPGLFVAPFVYGCVPHSSTFPSFIVAPSLIAPPLRRFCFVFAVRWGLGVPHGGGRGPADAAVLDLRGGQLGRARRGGVLAEGAQGLPAPRVPVQHRG